MYWPNGVRSTIPQLLLYFTTVLRTPAAILLHTRTAHMVVCVFLAQKSMPIPPAATKDLSCEDVRTVPVLVVVQRYYIDHHSNGTVTRKQTTTTTYLGTVL